MTSALTPTHADCPRCDGFGNDGFDETGAPYACYFCGCTGRILMAEAIAIEREETDFRERFAPKRLGIFVKQVYRHPEADDYGYDEDAPALKPGHRLFTAHIWPEPRVQRVHVASPWPDDDTPF